VFEAPSFMARATPKKITAACATSDAWLSIIATYFMVEPISLCPRKSGSEQMDLQAAREVFELKLDDYHTVDFNSGGQVRLDSSNGNDFARRYPTAEFRSV
jgi:hypothetical protein